MKSLLPQIESILSDRPRPGSPGEFSVEQIVEIVAVACEPPARSGLPISHWTTRELSQEAIERGLVKKISPSRLLYSNGEILVAKAQRYRRRGFYRSIEPKVLKAVRRQFGIANGVLNVTMP